MKVNTVACDILVVGAGVSGLAAAITASENGADTIVLERNSFLGGTVIAGMHRYICGMYDNISAKVISGKIMKKISRGLRRLNTRNRPLRLGKVLVFSFRNDDLKTCLQTLVKNKKNLKVILNSPVYRVNRKRALIESVEARQGSDILKVIPKVVIDASGEGAVIRLSKDVYCLAAPDKRQLAGFSFRLKGLKDTDGLLPIKVPYYVKFAALISLENKGDAIIRLNIPGGGTVTKMKKEARKILGNLRKFLPEFKNAYIDEFSPCITEREGIRLRGEYTLTANDVVAGKRFKDGVVKNSWPVELWNRKKGPQYRYLEPGQYYEIPLRCLKSKNIKNFLAAGRCISVTHEALGSTRAAGTCIALGEQAGLAAVKMSINL